MTPQEYRNKHHRCKWCEYEKYHWVEAGSVAWYTCTVKDKYIPEFDIFSNWRGCFCGVYKAKLWTDKD